MFKEINVLAPTSGSDFSNKNRNYRGFWIEENLEEDRA